MSYIHKENGCLGLAMWTYSKKIIKGNYKIIMEKWSRINGGFGRLSWVSTKAKLFVSYVYQN